VVVVLLVTRVLLVLEEVVEEEMQLLPEAMARLVQSGLELMVLEVEEEEVQPILGRLETMEELEVFMAQEVEVVGLEAMVLRVLLSLLTYRLRFP